MTHSRIDRKQALELYREDIITLGKEADNIRKKLHPDNIVTFVVDRNVNYTNICECKCSFCAFYRDEDAADAYLLSNNEIFRKIEELVEQGGTQLLMQGGLNKKLQIEYFENLFREIKKRFPTVQNHSLSPAEIVSIAKNSRLTIDDALQRLHAAGLDSLPGGGAEILVDEIRQSISPNKIGWRQWGDVMLSAAKLKMSTTATMMFGSKERTEDIIEHIFRIREIQDEGGSFTAFIPWTYQPGNSELGGETASGFEYLKLLSLSRIILDNIKNIQASWVTQGGKMAQISLSFGANDMGGTMLEENVVAAAGCSFKMSKDEMIALVKDAGFIPAQRKTTYNIMKIY